MKIKSFSPFILYQILNLGMKFNEIIKFSLRYVRTHCHLLYKSDDKIYIIFFRKGTIFLDMEGTSLEAIVDVLLENMINNDSITYDMRKSKYNYNKTFKRK